MISFSPSTALKNIRTLIQSFTAGSAIVVSPARIEAQMRLWREHLPTVHPMYAVKCNSDPLLLRTLKKLGAGFDCASIREVEDVRPLHPLSQILYAHPLKSDADIRRLNGVVYTTVVDSVEECAKLAVAGWSGDALVRLAVQDSGSKMPFSIKFGATKLEFLDIVRKSQIPLSGVSFHVGSDCNDPGQYREAIRTAIEAMTHLRGDKWTLDIGGGFTSSRFLDMADAIRKEIQTLENIRVIAEPGRFFAEPSQDLFVRVIAKKTSADGKRRYVIDESLYGQFSCIAFDGQQPAFIRVPRKDEVVLPGDGRMLYTHARQRSPGILFGRTCDSLDVICRGHMEELEVGDWLWFPCMGAYTSSTASEFNGFPKPARVEDTQGLLPSEQWARLAVRGATDGLVYSNSLVL